MCIYVYTVYPCSTFHSCDVPRAALPSKDASDWSLVCCKHSHFLWGNPLFLWPFSIAMFHYQRVIIFNVACFPFSLSLPVQCSMLHPWIFLGAAKCDLTRRMQASGFAASDLSVWAKQKHISTLERFGIVWSLAKFFESVHLAEMDEYTLKNRTPLY